MLSFTAKQGQITKQIKMYLFKKVFLKACVVCRIREIDPLFVKRLQLLLIISNITVHGKTMFMHFPPPFGMSIDFFFLPSC